MKEVKISNELKELCPDMTIGCIQAVVKVSDSSEELIKEMNEYCEELSEKIGVEDIAVQQRIKDASSIIMLIYSFSGSNDIENNLSYAKELLEKYADAEDITMKVIL